METEMTMAQFITDNWGILLVALVVITEIIYVVGMKSTYSERGFYGDKWRHKRTKGQSIFAKFLSVLTALLLIVLVVVPVAMHPEYLGPIAVGCGVLGALAVWMYLNYEIVDKALIRRRDEKPKRKKR